MERTGEWVEIVDYAAYFDALRLARGSYQRNILRGFESLSGSTLRGKAVSYSGRYRRSSAALLERVAHEGIPWHERIGDHGRRILVLGAWAPGSTE